MTSISGTTSGGYRNQASFKAPGASIHPDRKIGIGEKSKAFFKLFPAFGGILRALGVIRPPLGGEG